LLELLDDSPTTLLMVTHSPSVAARLAEKVVLHGGRLAGVDGAEMRIFRETLLALLSHWRQHPVQFFSVLTGLWLATSLLTGVQA
jgi:ABC-type nitrate/sulfonate/bicarbonate transport system ATPase subunit